MLSNLYSGKWLDNMNKMEKIYIGVYFADENVKEKFLEASKCRLGKTDSYNEKGRLFTYTTEDGKDTYYFYEFPLAQENDFSPSKLETILFVLDDGWVDFDYMFAGVNEANIDNVVFLYTGDSYDLAELKNSVDIGAYMSRVYAKCLAKQISLDDVIDGDKDACINFVDFFKEVKQHIHSFPFVINDFSYTQSGPRSVKCSGVIDRGFIEKGDRVSIFCKGGKEVVGKITLLLAPSCNPLLNGKKGQTVRFTVELDEDYLIEGSSIHVISKDKVKPAKEFNALVTMYDAEFDGYRTLDIKSEIEFHMFAKRYDATMLRQGIGYFEGEEQSFKSLSSGRSDHFSFKIFEEAPLVVGTRFYIEKNFMETGKPASYGYAVITEIIK